MLEDNKVQVIVRVRPLTSSYSASSILAASDGVKRCIRGTKDASITLETSETFTFDFVAGENISQDQMFEKIGKPIVDSCLQGYNSTIFAYG